MANDILSQFRAQVLHMEDLDFAKYFCTPLSTQSFLPSFVPTSQNNILGTPHFIFGNVGAGRQMPAEEDWEDTEEEMGMQDAQ